MKPTPTNRQRTVNASAAAPLIARKKVSPESKRLDAFAQRIVEARKDIASAELRIFEICGEAKADTALWRDVNFDVFLRANDVVPLQFHRWEKTRSAVSRECLLEIGFPAGYMIAVIVELNRNATIDVAGVLSAKTAARFAVRKLRRPKANVANNIVIEIASKLKLRCPTATAARTVTGSSSAWVNEALTTLSTIVMVAAPTDAAFRLAAAALLKGERDHGLSLSDDTRERIALGTAV